MKTHNIFFLVLWTVFSGMLMTGCASDDENETDMIGFYQEDAKSFKEQIDYDKSNKYSYVVVDYRSKEAYDASHIPGAVWLVEGTTLNVSDGTFAQSLLNYCADNKRGVNTDVFLYGTDDANLMGAVGRSVSSTGFYKVHTYVLEDGFKAWQQAGYSLEAVK